MDLESSKVHRNLSGKLTILGMELFDLLAVATFAAVMNLIFGKTSLSLVMVFLIPGTVGLTLYFGKKNKPENFLIHALRYYIMPGAFAPGILPSHEEKMRRTIYH